MLFAVACTPTAQAPTDDEVWRALTSFEIAPTDQIQVVTDLRIERLGSGEASVPEPARSQLCLPQTLRQSDRMVRGQSFLVSVVRKSDGRELAIIDFTRWEGEPGWWISTTAPVQRCLPLA